MAILGRLLLIVLIIIGFSVWFSTPRTDGVAFVEAAADEPASVIEAPAYIDFTQIGTLVFYPNNVGPVPYLFYQENGHTVAKALSFTDVPAPFNFSTWAGARVVVTGHLSFEHVVVSQLSYVSGP